MPVRNEADTISEAVFSVLSQTIEPHEIIVVDGMSDDGTRAILAKMAETDRHVRVLENPERTVPHGLNRGIAAATGDVIARMDGHAYLPADYLERTLAMLTDGVWVAGGGFSAAGVTPAGEAAAHAMHSRFGMGGGAALLRGEPRAVDGVPFGVFRREVFDRIGLYDPDLTLSEDEELFQRVREAGGTIWADSSLFFVYMARSSWSGLFRQYLRWGFYKALAIRKRPGLFRWRHAVPSLFVLALVGGIAALAWSPWPLIAVIGAWLSLASYAAITLRPRRIAWPLILPAFALMHVGYGVGLLAGAVRWAFSPATSRAARPSDHGTTR